MKKQWNLRNGCWYGQVLSNLLYNDKVRETLNMLRTILEYDAQKEVFTRTDYWSKERNTLCKLVL